MWFCDGFWLDCLVVKDFYHILAFAKANQIRQHVIMGFWNDITNGRCATIMVAAAVVVISTITIIAVGTGIGTGTTPVGVRVHICR